jgi:hypothetical protein
LVEKEVDDYVEDAVPGFSPSNYMEDTDLEKVNVIIDKKGAWIALDDFVDDAHFPCAIALVTENNFRAANKKKDRRWETEQHRKVYVDLGTNEEE